MQQVVKAVDEQGQQGSKEHLQMHVSCPHSSRHPRHQLSWKQLPAGGGISFERSKTPIEAYSRRSQERPCRPARRYDCIVVWQARGLQLWPRSCDVKGAFIKQTEKFKICLSLYAAERNHTFMNSWIVFGLYCMSRSCVGNETHICGFTLRLLSDVHIKQ